MPSSTGAGQAQQAAGERDTERHPVEPCRPRRTAGEEVQDQRIRDKERYPLPFASNKREVHRMHTSISEETRQRDSSGNHSFGTRHEIYF